MQPNGPVLEELSRAEVTDAGDIARLDKLGLESWAPGSRDHFIRIVPGMVTGRPLRVTGC
jgi:hypothetical protein